jgi:hypothetical protein
MCVIFFSAFSIQKKMIQLTDQEFDASMAQLEEIRFLNVSFDSETAHSPTLVDCIVSNPFSSHARLSSTYARVCILQKGTPPPYLEALRQKGFISARDPR